MRNSSVNQTGQFLFRGFDEISDLERFSGRPINSSPHSRMNTSSRVRTVTLDFLPLMIVWVWGNKPFRAILSRRPADGIPRSAGPAS